VPEAVVDRLEPVEVQHEHGCPGRTALGTGHGPVDAIPQQGPVREPGQRVVEREPPELLLRLFELLGPFGDACLEIDVQPPQLLGHHVDADDHGVDLVRGG
jgi:hypothetical protein